MSHSPWYRRIQTYTCRQAQESEINLTTAFSSRKRTLRTTRFGNGAEKVRKITVTKPDAMAARKKDKEENETLDDLQQNEVERGSIQPLLKTNSEAAETMLIRTANVLRRLDERWTDGVENRKLRALSAPASPPSRRFQTMSCCRCRYRGATGSRVLRAAVSRPPGQPAGPGPGLRVIAPEGPSPRSDLGVPVAYYLTCRE